MDAAVSLYTSVPPGQNKTPNVDISVLTAIAPCILTTLFTILTKSYYFSSLKPTKIC